MSDRDFGVTEVLAGAPELIRRFEQATPTQRAILNAAIDARRLGLQGPLTAQNLSALARASMTDPHAGQALFARAMDELTEKRRATAPLIPVRRRDGQALGYTVADYLLQRATAERRAVPVNARMWDALIAVPELDASDTFRLGSSAWSIVCCSTTQYLCTDGPLPLATVRLSTGSHSCWTGAGIWSKKSRRSGRTSRRPCGQGRSG